MGVSSSLVYWGLVVILIKILPSQSKQFYGDISASLSTLPYSEATGSLHFCSLVYRAAPWVALCDLRVQAVHAEQVLCHFAGRFFVVVREFLMHGMYLAPRGEILRFFWCIGLRCYPCPPDGDLHMLVDVCIISSPSGPLFSASPCLELVNLMSLRVAYTA